MKTLISAVVCAAALVSAPAFASKDLATAKGCLACHSQGADMKIGPGYQAVAKKYLATPYDPKATQTAEAVAPGNN